MIVRTLAKNEIYYRVIAPQYADQPTSGKGAAKQGGRFNRPEQEALYLSRDIETALAEYKQDNPWLPPGTICTFFVSGLRIADFSKGFDAEHWSSLWADYAVDWRYLWFNKGIESPTWYMADDLLAAGLDGLLFPSQSHQGGTNLVIYDSLKRATSTLSIYDPQKTLRK